AFSKMASTIKRQFIHTAEAPAPVGPYSQAVRVGDIIYLSGSVGMVPETMEMPKGIEAQTHQSLKNIGALLKAAGVGYGNVVKSTVLLTSMDDFATVNAIYKEYFPEKFPARTAYQVSTLPVKALVEIEVLAVANKIEDVPPSSL
ncbi:hypothetical protein PENTCL1PPCAC_15501, partial [Pristionchus entomophagus]